MRNFIELSNGALLDLNEVTYVGGIASRTSLSSYLVHLRSGLSLDIYEQPPSVTAPGMAREVFVQKLMATKLNKLEPLSCDD